MNLQRFYILIFGLFIISCGTEEDSPPPQTIVNVPEPVTQTPTQYALTVSPSEGGFVSTEGGTYDQGTEVSILATPAQGYIFDKWSNGVESRDITITVDKDISLTPQFYRTNIVYSESVIAYSEISDLTSYEVNALLGGTSAATLFEDFGYRKVLLIGPIDNTDQIGERPMKHFIKEGDEWTYLRDYEVFQDGGPRSYRKFSDGSYGFASHGLEPKNRPNPLGYMWKVENLNSDNIIFNRVSDHKGFWHSVAIGDLNYDGLEDMVAVQMGNEIFSQDGFPFHTFLATDSSNFQYIESEVFIDKSVITFPSGGSVCISDIDKDGSVDIILGAYSPHVYDAPIVHQSVFGDKYGIEVYSDADRDGIYELQQDYNFPLGSFAYSNVGSTKMEVIDIDNDDDLDLLVFYEGNIDEQTTMVEYNLMDVFYNEGSRSFRSENIFIKYFDDLISREFNLFDINQDGLIDILLNPDAPGGFGLNQNLVEGEIDNATGDGTIKLNPAIFINQGDEFIQETRNYRYPIKNLSETFFKPFVRNNELVYLGVTSDVDSLRILELKPIIE